MLTATEATVDLSKDELLSLFRTMLVIRKCELELARSFQKGLIHGACHTYVGEEAIAAGVCAHLSNDDVVFSTHRGHGHALAKGVPAREVIAELFGRADGVSGGRGGSMHLFAPDVGLMGTSGIVGPCILQALGAAYSFKVLASDNVAVAFFGDGGSNNGAFHEGLNLASIFNLPVIFVCENNQFATEVAITDSGGNPNIAERAAAYNLPGVVVDGNDVFAVHTATAEAVERARSGGGATLLECTTYRTRPHAEGMGDFTYRTREDVDAWKQRCPIKALREYLIADGCAAPDELDAIDEEIADATTAAREFAEASEYPDPATASLHVYAATDRTVTEPGPNTTDRELSYMQATLEALTFEMAINPTIFVMGQGIGERGGNFATTTGLYDKYGPVRLCDTPICERGFVGLTTGAAMTGTRPIIDFMFGDFILDAVGEIINQIAKMQYMTSGALPVPILLRGCFGIGHSAATHHSGAYYPMYANFPGLRVVVPSNAYDAKGLFTHALRCNDPVIFLEHKELLSSKCPVPEEDYEIPFGKAAIVREGADVTVVAIARMVQLAGEAAAGLDAEGVRVELIDPRTISPLDTATILASVAKTGRLLIVDETFAPCGVGGEIAAQVVDQGFNDLDAPIKRLNGAHSPTPYSPTLEAAVVPSTEEIAAAIRDLMAE
ncbi:MAG TPA: dehydrogenase [Lentisphaeria bacterium]|nr:dehydrogenase [Lentisphaeria bacterium]|tara:strand:- start:2933 stop:4936 length:2004 start_codon:yes stop_codon:yes gene_type:complete